MSIMPFKYFLNPYILCIILGIFLSPNAGFASVDTDSLHRTIEPELAQAAQRFYPELSFDYAFDLDALNPYKFDVSTLQDTFLLVVSDSLCGFAFPHSGKVNSTFGWRKGRVHSGIDLQLEWGDTIRGAFDGVVRVSQYHKGYGNFIIIRHFNGLETLYAHLQSRFVVHGDAVAAGQIIGQGGSTGRSTGAHLHFETRFLGRPIDPETFIDFDARCLRSSVASVHAGSFDIPQTKKSQRLF